MLMQYFCKLIPNSEQIWRYRKELAHQLALSGFLSFAMKIGDRSLHKVFLSKKTGKLIYPVEAIKKVVE